MTNNNKKLVQGKNWFRIFARIVSVPIGWFCFYGIVVSLWEGPSVTLEDIIFAVGYAILLAGVIIAWWREKIGGILLSAYAIIMVVYYVVNAFYKYSITPNLSAWDKFRNSFTSEFFINILFYVVLLLVGILFLLSDWKAKRQKIKETKL